ncbi:MAG: leucine-rich repeat domain-containing protein [Candidatus Berkiella sp.]
MCIKINYQSLIVLDPNQVQNIETGDFKNFSFKSLSEEQFKTFIEKISLCQNLQFLSFESCELGELSPFRLHILLNTIARLPKVRSLDLSWNKFGQFSEEGWSQVFKDFYPNKTLKILNLSGNNLGRVNQPWFDAFWQGMNQQFQLQSLDLSWNELNQLSLAATEALWMNLKALPSLTHLDLSDNNLEQLESNIFDRFFIGIYQCKALQRLNLKGNSFGKLPIESFQASLQNVVKIPLVFFNLAYCGLHQFESHQEQVVSLFETLSKCSSLRHLYIEGNNFSRESIQVLTDKLSQSQAPLLVEIRGDLSERLKELIIQNRKALLAYYKNIGKDFANILPCEMVEEILKKYTSDEIEKPMREKVWQGYFQEKTEENPEPLLNKRYDL